MKIISEKEMKEAIKTRSRAGKPWKYDIVEYLTKCKDYSASDLEIYDATRPDRLEIPETKKIHNMASEWTYIHRDNVANVVGNKERRTLVSITEATAKLLQINKP